ncbi:conserved Plasmodium protein, unknown function [Plasmodium reichenowi]|uniref:Uncharacterized protein n=1 Tax=Plasmodium reichenowi TaxID=5854 RepID=A0A2P9DFN9_PLARE|nr:conserved Plasmodium protein, unknown function [Plasmodium reichenowi]
MVLFQNRKIFGNFKYTHLIINYCTPFPRYNINYKFNNVMNKFHTNSKINIYQYKNYTNHWIFLKYNNMFKRFYNPRANINWTLIRFRHRVSQLRKKKLKYKNHSKVALRFRLTKFGWERLQSGRNASKKNVSTKKYYEKMKIKYVSRDDVKKFKFQMPSYVLRIRDSPVDYNPNIMRARKFLPTHFG